MKKIFALTMVLSSITAWASDYSCEAILISGAKVKQLNLVPTTSKTLMVKSDTTQFSVTEVDSDTVVLSITDSARRELVASSTSFIPQAGKAAAHLSVLLSDGSATIVCKVN